MKLMSTSVNNLFEKEILNKDNIRKAIRNASKDKQDNVHVVKVIMGLEKYVDNLYNLLAYELFEPSPYQEEEKKCRIKTRIIKKHDFYPDRCIEHLIALVMLPHWNKIVRDCTFASWKGRGINAKNLRYNINHRIKSHICSHKLSNELYCLRFDVKKCYESVDNERLKLVVFKYCKDKRLNALIIAFIDSCEGLPIGSYMSQLLINLYLTQLDNFLINECKVLEYVRYMDDGAIFSEDKQYLQALKYRIMNFLWYELGLELNSKRQVFPLGRSRRGRSLDLCGYCFYRNFTLIRKRTKIRIKNAIDKPRSMASYKGLLMNCDSTNLIKSLGYEHIQEVGH